MSIILYIFSIVLIVSTAKIYTIDHVYGLALLGTGIIFGLFGLISEINALKKNSYDSFMKNAIDLTIDLIMKKEDKNEVNTDNQ